ncbi:MAG: hypothetical protein WC797_04545, partial [Candidatus Paceibacterota bacterium]|jgi:phenylalanyl-tRNA synthetase beta chain
MDTLTKLIVDLAGSPETLVSKKTDVYPDPQKSYKISVSLSEINKVLGITLAETDVDRILGLYEKHADFVVVKKGGKYEITVPPERIDLICIHGPYTGGVKEDIIEEIGRVYGYDKISPKALKKEKEPNINKRLYYTELIRELLTGEGYSEVLNYSFVEEGNEKENVEILNPLAENKRFIRKDLATNFLAKLDSNVRNADLLGLDFIKIFEFGNVFKPGDEHNNFAIGVAPRDNSKKGEKDAKTEFERITKMLGSVLGVDIVSKNIKGDRPNYCEVDFTSLLADFSEPKSYDDIKISKPANVLYSKISPFPFIVRDIALFVGENDKPEYVVGVLIGGDESLIVRTKLFDTFLKTFADGSKKMSYAFRFVFQSHDKTLTNEEVNLIMDRISKKASQKGWQVR